MRILQLATIGDDNDPIKIGIREFPVSKLILIHDPNDKDKAVALKAELEVLKLEVELRDLKNNAMMDMMEIVARILTEEELKFDDIYFNVTGGTKIMSCAAISASFVNGIKAFHVADGKPMQLPVLRFRLQELISESKFALLRALQKAGGSVESLNDLSKHAKVEKSLLSYHIRGGRDSKGLEELGFVEIDRGSQGRLVISLTPMGRLILVGRHDN